MADQVGHDGVAGITRFAGITTRGKRCPVGAGHDGILRQPVGEACGGLWTFACAVGGRGERAWGRLPRAFEAG